MIAVIGKGKKECEIKTEATDDDVTKEKGTMRRSRKGDRECSEGQAMQTQAVERVSSNAGERVADICKEEEGGGRRRRER